MNRTYRSRNSGSGNRRRKTRRPGALALVVVLVLLIGVTAGVMALLKPGGGGNNPGPTATGTGGPDLDGSTFLEGVFVDDIALGGLTMEQAKQKVEAKQQEFVAANSVTITKDGQTALQIGVAETACTFDTDAIMGEALKQGHEGTKEEQLAAQERLKTTPVKLVTTATIDPAAVEQKVRDLVTPYTKAAVDATFVKYDVEKPEGERLVFTPDVPGEKVDADSLWAAVKTAFETRAFGTVEMQVVPMPAAITLAGLQGEMQLIGEFESNIKNYKKQRRKNIELASAAISGLILMPGETFSMNEKTGERTEAKGYQKAPVDQNGIEDVGLGGGVCQVSSALYNAAIACGPDRISIVERNHHSLVSGYMAKGTDATVDYPNKDLKFKNISDKPILIIVYYDYDSKRSGFDYRMHAKFYGVPDPTGATYVLQGDVVKTLKGDATKTRKVPSSAVPPGQTELIPAHNGYVVDVYLVKVDKDGKKTKVKKLYTDTYPADCNVLAYYKKDAVPTDTPEATATPDATAPAETSTTKPTQAPTTAPTTAPATDPPADSPQAG